MSWLAFIGGVVLGALIVAGVIAYLFKDFRPYR